MCVGRSSYLELRREARAFEVQSPEPSGAKISCHGLFGEVATSSWPLTAPVVVVGSHRCSRRTSKALNLLKIFLILLKIRLPFCLFVVTRRISSCGKSSWTNRGPHPSQRLDPLAGHGLLIRCGSIKMAKGCVA